MRLLLILSPVALMAAQPPAGASRLVLKDSQEAARFAAVAKVGGCSGAVVRPRGAPSNAPALLLTAGHCIDLGVNDVILARPDSRTAELNYHVDGRPEERRRIRSKRVLYSTMKSTDLALLELEETLADVPSLELSTESPQEADWAGVPTLGVPNHEQFLRTSPCTLGPAVDVIEWRWFWRGMLRNDCSDISGGASGSPVISRSNQVVAVITTTNVGVLQRGGNFDCWRDNPCESTGYRRNTSYAAPVRPLAGCFTDGLFDLRAHGCGLDPGRQAQVLESRLAVQPGERWNARVGSDTLPFYRYKTFREGQGDCAADAGYSEPRPIAATVVIDDPIAYDEGRYYLCVIGGDAEWQPARFAAVAHIRVDGAKPVLRPEIRFVGSSIIPTFAAPEIASAPIKFEAAEQDTCDDPQGYRSIYPIPLAVPAGSRRICIIAADAAGNQSEPYRIELQGPTLLPRDLVQAAGHRAGAATPGAWIALFGRDLRESAVELVDASGRRHTLEIALFSAAQVNARVPDDAALGPAGIELSGLQTRLEIEAVVPGIFTPNGAPWGWAAALAVRDDGTLEPTYHCLSNCFARPVTAVRTMVLYAGGLGRDGASIKVRLAGQELELIHGAEEFGVYRLTVRIPETLQLRGFLPLTVEAAGKESPETFVQFF